MNDKSARGEGKRPIAATYQANVTLRGEIAPLDAPLVTTVEETLAAAVAARFPSYDVTVRAMRTDR